MKRLPDWQKRMVEALRSCHKQEFQRGVTDCVFTVANIVQAYTGEDIAEQWRGKYATDYEALRWVAQLDGGFIGEVKRQLTRQGLQQIGVNYAQQGDIAWMYVAGEGAFTSGLGLFDSAGVLTPGKLGMRRFTRSTAKLAWRVPL